MLGWSLHTWEDVMLVSLLAAAIAAVFVIVSTYAVVQLQRREAEDAKKDFSAYKLTVEGKVAEAKREGIQAATAAAGGLPIGSPQARRRR